MRYKTNLIFILSYSAFMTFFSQRYPSYGPRRQLLLLSAKSEYGEKKVNITIDKKTSSSVFLRCSKRKLQDQTSLALVAYPSALETEACWNIWRNAAPKRARFCECSCYFQTWISGTTLIFPSKVMEESIAMVHSSFKCRIRRGLFQELLDLWCFFEVK